MRWIIMVLIISIALVSGCNEAIIPPPAVEGYNPELQNPQFVGFAVEMDCTSHFSSNLTELSAVCGINESQTAVEYNITTGNWSTICCTFDTDKCHWEAVSTPEELCNNNTASKPFNIVKDDNDYYRARCCNSQGKDCYVDYNIDPTNTSSVCDKQYTLFEMSVNYTTPLWYGLCCQGGYK